MGIEVVRSTASAHELVSWIDRSEEIVLNYTYRSGLLKPAKAQFDAPPWDPVGSGEHTVSAQVRFLTPIIERGAVALAGHIDGLPAGVAVVEEHFEDDMAWLAWLHVSAGSRRTGLGSALWQEAEGVSRVAGATRMYVSATPSGSAVGFYRGRGCELADPPHSELFAAEPEDIHFVKYLD